MQTGLVSAQLFGVCKVIEEYIPFIETQIGYVFKKKSLLIQAFTRRSFAEENKGFAHNEVLETIGDAVIQLYTTIALTKGNISEISEGKLTSKRQTIVNGENLSRHAKRLDIVKKEYFLLGKGDLINNKVYENTKVQGDLIESIVGAVALDCRFSNVKLVKFVPQLLQLDKLGKWWQST